MEILMKHVSLTYPDGRQALKDISLTLRSPGLIGLLGPNGAGKSTLMKLLTASLLPSSGTILADGQPLEVCERRLKSCLGCLPQEFGLFDELTVCQFLDYMAALKGLSGQNDAVGKAISAVRLEEKAKSRISSLSGGQRQRVGIAQALLGEPSFLIFDEPTAGLDPEERAQFRNQFSRLAKDRLVLLSTHIIEDIQAVCSQLVVLCRGQILFWGTPEELIRTVSPGNLSEDAVPTGKASADTVPRGNSPLEDAYLTLISREGGR